jgi:hypothetical protein
VDQAFVAAITELTSKITFLETHKSIDVVALRETEPKVTQLKLKVRHVNHTTHTHSLFLFSLQDFE